MFRCFYIKNGIPETVAYFSDLKIADAIFSFRRMDDAFPGKELLLSRAESVEFKDGEEIVTVYFESGSHADRVALIKSEALYNNIAGGFETLASDHRMEVTESVDHDPAYWLEPLWENLREKHTWEGLHGKKAWLKNLNKGEKNDS